MAGFVLDEFLPYRLAVAAQKVSREFSDIYRTRFGLSVAEWRVIAHLSKESPVSVRDITERVDLEKSRVSRAAARLSAEGYVTKTTDPGDRRLVRLALSEEGRALIDEIAPLAEAFEARIMEGLGPSGSGFQAGLDHLLAEMPRTRPKDA